MDSTNLLVRTDHESNGRFAFNYNAVRDLEVAPVNGCFAPLRRLQLNRGRHAPPILQPFTIPNPSRKIPLAGHDFRMPRLMATAKS